MLIVGSRGHGGFAGPVSYPAGDSPVGITMGKFNGDARPDLAVVSANSHGISVLLGAGKGTFGTATDFAAGSTPVCIAASDLDDDATITRRRWNRACEDLRKVIADAMERTA